MKGPKAAFPGPLSYDLLVVGRPSCDLIFAGLPDWPRPGHETYSSAFEVSAGGCFNLAAAGNRLGLSVGFVGIVGDDLWGRVVRDELDREGLAPDLLHIAKMALPAVSIALSADGDRGFVTHEPDVAVADRELVSHARSVVRGVEARHMHVDLRPNVLALAPIARERGLSISADTGGWETWLRSRDVWELVPLVDILFTNESEASHMTGHTDMRKAGELLASSCKTVVIKRGSRGSLAVVEGVPVEAPTTPVDVVDATGAGDCYNAGYLYGWLRGLSPEVCARLGNLCGGLAVRAIGGHQGCPDEKRLLELAGGLEAGGLEAGDIEAGGPPPRHAEAPGPGPEARP